MNVLRGATPDEKGFKRRTAEAAPSGTRVAAPPALQAVRCPMLVERLSDARANNAGAQRQTRIQAGGMEGAERTPVPAATLCHAGSWQSPVGASRRLW